jgi:DNA-binding beta-propeller fold protein YncE
LEASAGDVDALGNVYLLTASEQVVIVDPNGHVVRSFGEHGSSEGQFNYRVEISTPLYPQGTVAGADLAVGPNGTIYVADGGNFRVQAFDPAGKFLFAWGMRGQVDGEFEVPWAIATDRQGYVYVGDFTGTIQKFDRDGRFLTRFGKGRGAGQGQFVGAVYDLEADTQGNIYAADRKSGRIQKFDPAGNFVTEWDRCGNSLLDIRGLAVDAEGRVYVATRSGQRVCVFDSSGQLITTFGQEGLRDGQFLFGDSNLDLAVGPDGSVVVADSAGERLQKFKPEGKLSKK